MAVAANVRLLASPLVRQAAELLTSSAKTEQRTTDSLRGVLQTAAPFFINYITAFNTIDERFYGTSV